MDNLKVEKTSRGKEFDPFSSDEIRRIGAIKDGRYCSFILLADYNDFYTNSIGKRDGATIRKIKDFYRQIENPFTYMAREFPKDAARFIENVDDPTLKSKLEPVLAEAGKHNRYIKGLKFKYGDDLSHLPKAKDGLLAPNAKITEPEPELQTKNILESAESANLLQNEDNGNLVANDDIIGQEAKEAEGKEELKATRDLVKEEASIAPKESSIQAEPSAIELKAEVLPRDEVSSDPNKPTSPHGFWGFLRGVKKPNSTSAWGEFEQMAEQRGGTETEQLKEAA